MGILDKFKISTAIDRLSEERLYEQVAQELKAGKKREGIWVKAMAKSGGDLNKAEALYIEYRVQSLSDEAQIINDTNQEALRENRLATSEKGCRQILKDKGYVLHSPILNGYWVRASHPGVLTLKEYDCLYETVNLDDLYNWAVDAKDLS